MRPTIKLKDCKRPDKIGVNLIVFSKDRAMQLDALFSSIAINAEEFFSNIDVVYDYSDHDYQNGYTQLIIEYQQVNFIRQQDFCQDIKDSLKKRFPFVMFLTDDDIIFDKIVSYPIRNFLHSDPDIVCFSFRLGNNITYCYSADKPNKLGVHSLHKNHTRSQNVGAVEFISWSWREQELDFAYPLSVTAHAFKRSTINDIVKDLYFATPNQFEAKIQQYREGLPRDMVAYTHSKIVGVPANRVNQDYPNRNGLRYPYSTSELNQMFLKGKRIDITKMDFSNINAAQQELKYEFQDLVG